MRLNGFSTIAPLASDRDTAWRSVLEVVMRLPRVRVIDAVDGRVRVECLSRVWRFVDDLEVWIDDASRALHLSSSARVGGWDLGVNRRRVERVLDQLAARGVIA